MATHRTIKPDRQKPRWIRSAKLRRILDAFGVAVVVAMFGFIIFRAIKNIMQGNFAPRADLDLQMRYTGILYDPVSIAICSGIVLFAFLTARSRMRRARKEQQAKRGNKGK